MYRDQLNCDSKSSIFVGAIKHLYVLYLKVPLKLI